MEYWLIAHLWGDYILQNDVMAIRKKDYWSVSIAHGIFYIIPFLPMVVFGSTELWQLVAICIQHILQDKLNFIVKFMKFIGCSDFATGPCSPWSIILVDNILHITFIWTILNIHTLGV